MRKRRTLFPLMAIALLFPLSGCKTETTKEAPSGPQSNAAASVIVLTEEAMKIAKIQIEKAELRKVPAKIYAAGDMAFNQKRLMNLTSRVAGRVENVSAYIGDHVKEGDILLSLYSPEFLTSQAEFLQAAERLRRLSKDNLQDDIGAAQALLDSAKRKLMLLGMKEADIKELEETRQIKTLLPISAPFSGTIIESPVVKGDQVSEGAALFKIADLSVLWAHVHIYEKDLSLVKQGMPALVRVQAYPGQGFQGRLTLLSDVVEQNTRAVIGRVEVQNTRGLLKPGMYVEAELALPSSAVALLVPESAVQELEGKNVVFIPAGERSFRSQEVKVGQRFHDLVEITEGLSLGDSYVRDGFLLKSEYLKKNLAVE